MERYLNRHCRKRTSHRARVCMAMPSYHLIFSQGLFQRTTFVESRRVRNSIRIATALLPNNLADSKLGEGSEYTMRLLGLDSRHQHNHGHVQRKPSTNSATFQPNPKWKPRILPASQRHSICTSISRGFSFWRQEPDRQPKISFKTPKAAGAHYWKKINMVSPGSLSIANSCRLARK